MSFLFLGLLRHKLKETADFLLVEGLTNVKTLHLLLIAALRDLDFHRHVARIVVGETLDIETAGFLQRRCREIRLVGILHLSGHTGYDSPEDAGTAWVGIEEPAYYGLLSISTT